MGLLVQLLERRAAKAEDRKRAALPADRIFRHKITGTNPKTGRRKTATVVCGSWEDLSNVEARTGLLPPYLYQDDLPPVSEAQVDLMKKRRIPLIPGMCRYDASVLIQHSLDGEPVFPSSSLPRPVLQFFVDRGEVVSAFMAASDFEDEFLADRPGLRRLLKNCK